MRASIVSAIAGLAALGAAPALAEVSVDLQPVAEGLTAPVQLVSPPGDERRFIVEQIGVIRILEPDGTLNPEPFLNIRHKIVEQMPDFDERGLLGLAFHPDFQENGRFFVAYSGRLPGDAPMDHKLWYDHANYVAEYQVDPDTGMADPSTERIISVIDWPQFNHNGHWIGFGPDGMLYISTGDGGYANDWGIGHDVVMGNGQDPSSLHGKILRVDVDSEQQPYGIPEDNPFVDDPQAAPEVWAMGLRNPWRCSFDMGGENELFCADVGQNAYEEVDIVRAGENYGWRVKEGTHCFDYVNPNSHPETCDDAGLVGPIVEYQNCNVFPDCKGLSVTGGYVYRGQNPDWDGLYFFGDWSRRFDRREGSLFVARPGEDGNWSMEDVTVRNMPEFNDYVLGFGQDNDGEIYVTASKTTGPNGGLDTVYKIVPPGSATAELPEDAEGQDPQVQEAQGQEQEQPQQQQQQ